MLAGVCCRPCNPSKWEADIWGWPEVRRSAMIHFNKHQRPHWACRQYGHTGGTRGWLGVERWQLCLRDTSRSANCHRRAAVGHWISLCVKCSGMVDSAKMAILDRYIYHICTCERIVFFSQQYIFHEKGRTTTFSSSYLVTTYFGSCYFHWHQMNHLAIDSFLIWWNPSYHSREIVKWTQSHLRHAHTQK